MSDEIKKLRQDLADVTHLVLRLLDGLPCCPYCGVEKNDFHPSDQCFAARTIDRVFAAGRKP